MKSMNYYLLRREWLQYRSFGKSWLLVWAIYLGLYLLMGISASFVITFLPIIMTYSCRLHRQAGRGGGGLPAPRTSCCGAAAAGTVGPLPVCLSGGAGQPLSWWSAPYCCASC